jgi:hypothetical protein
MIVLRRPPGGGLYSLACLRDTLGAQTSPLCGLHSSSKRQLIELATVLIHRRNIHFAE